MMKYGVVWLSLIKYDVMVEYDHIWCGMVKYDQVWCGMVDYARVWCGMA